MDTLTRLILLAAVSLFVGCGDDSGGTSSGTVTDCSSCSGSQVCVKTFADQETTACMPIPDACQGQADCFDQGCAAAMYELCGADIVNTGCSDTFPPTVISCNP